MQNENVNFDDKLLNRMWQVKPDADFSFFKGGKKFSVATSKNDQNGNLIKMKLVDFFPDTNSLKMEMIEYNYNLEVLHKEIQTISTDMMNYIPMIFLDNIENKEKVYLYNWLNQNAIPIESTNFNLIEIISHKSLTTPYNYDINFFVVNNNFYYLTPNENGYLELYKYNLQTDKSVKTQTLEHYNNIYNPFFSYNDKAYQISDAVYVFDTVSSSIQKVCNLPEKIDCFNKTVIVGDKIYCFNPLRIGTRTNDVCVYDIKTNSFTYFSNNNPYNVVSGVYEKGELYLSVRDMNDNYFKLVKYDINKNIFTVKIPALDDLLSSSQIYFENNELYFVGHTIKKYNFTNNTFETVLERNFFELSGVPFVLNNKKYFIDDVLQNGNRLYYLFEYLSF